MKRLILCVTLGVLLYVSAASAADGDMLVSGNVGIGTTSPTHKLEVNGTVYINAGAANAGVAAQILNPSANGYGLSVQSGSGSSGNAVISAINNNSGSLFYVLDNGNYYFGGAMVSTKEHKKKVQPFSESASDLLKNIQVVTYKYNEDNNARADRIGFIANDETHPIDNRLTANGTGFDTPTIVGVLIRAVQEQMLEIEQLSARIQDLEGKGK